MASLIQLFDSQFESIHRRSVALLNAVPGERLFWLPPAVESSGESYSCGELLIRSAAAVEQTFGGITRRLWDDPFEWSLPEELADKMRLAAYFDEVDVTRRNGFAFFRSDDDLSRQIAAPEKLKPIAQILLESISRSSHLQGRAYGVAMQFLRLRPHLP